MKTILPLILLLGAFVAASHAPTQAQAARADAPTYSGDGKLVRPDDYREWVYLTSGLGMTYGPAGTGRPPMFDNVFVTRESYRQFMQKGTWPEKTMFILEIRGAETSVSIDNGGQTQGGIVAIEAEVKDRIPVSRNRVGLFRFWRRDETSRRPPRRCRHPRPATHVTAGTRRWKTRSCSSIPRSWRWRAAWAPSSPRTIRRTRSSSAESSGAG